LRDEDEDCEERRRDRDGKWGVEEGDDDEGGRCEDIDVRVDASEEGKGFDESAGVGGSREEEVDVGDGKESKVGRKEDEEEEQEDSRDGEARFLDLRGINVDDLIE
jgi:hypothetical protein